MTEIKNSKQYDLEGRTNESLSKKDFVMRVKISRKEAKESRYWLELIDCASNAVLEQERASLIKEATELMMILSAIMRKSEALSIKHETN